MLITALVFTAFKDRIISQISKSHISSLQLSAMAAQPGFSVNCSETFSGQGLNLCLLVGIIANK